METWRYTEEPHSNQCADKESTSIQPAEGMQKIVSSPSVYTNMHISTMSELVILHNPSVAIVTRQLKALDDIAAWDLKLRRHF